MSEMTPRQASETAGANYASFKKWVRAAEVTRKGGRQNLDYADQAQQSVERSMAYITANPNSEFARSAKESMSRNEYQRDAAIEMVGKLATQAARTELKANATEREGKAFYEANNGALQDAAAAEAMLDGVHINVQQPPEIAQEVPVHTPEHIDQ